VAQPAAGMVFGSRARNISALPVSVAAIWPMDAARKTRSRPNRQARQWVAKDPANNDLLRQRFLELSQRAIAGELDAWSAEATEGLALELLLDQFPRQIWREMAMAFAGDGRPLP